MSWHYLRELEGESLVDICSDGEPFAPLKSKITHAVFYSNGKLMDSYLDSLSGTMSPHSMENLGEEKSMSSAVDFHARTLVQQEKEQELMESEVECGKKWQGSFAKYNPDTHSLRTHQCLLFEDSTESCATLPKWGLMLNGECWEQTPLGLVTIEKEFGYWPTPTATDWKATGKLETLKRQGNNFEAGGQNRPQYHYSRLMNMKMPVSASEMMMLWPIGWTDLNPLETDKSPCAPQQHGEY
jgi:hypothetical protein